MPRFFVPEVTGDLIDITGADARHISFALRMAKGDEIVLCNNGIDYECVIDEFSDELVRCRVIALKRSSSEPNIDVTLYQALPKGDKFETIIQKSVELGVKRIVPVMTKRCVSRPDERTFEKKLQRYRKISEEASKQSGRGIIPEITGIVSFENMISEAAGADVGIICYERKGGKRFSEVGLRQNISVSLIIGSEGGFDGDEAEYAVKCGIIPVWMGERILRCETAPLAALSVIMNLSGNL